MGGVAWDTQIFALHSDRLWEQMLVDAYERWLQGVPCNDSIRNLLIGINKQILANIQRTLSTILKQPNRSLWNKSPKRKYFHSRKDYRRKNLNIWNFREAILIKHHMYYQGMHIYNIMASKVTSSGTEFPQIHLILKAKIESSLANGGTSEKMDLIAIVS